MWKKNQDMPDEGGIRIPGSKRFRNASDDPGQIHVESVKSKARHQIVFTAVAFVLLFCVMAGYYCRYAIVNRRELFDNGYNSRESLLAMHNRRGTIYSTADFSTDFEVLAESDNDNNRSYPYGEMFCHAVGFSIYGGSGIEDYMRYELMTSNISFEERLRYDRENSLYPGNDVYTTLDVNLQRYAYEALLRQYFRGAVIITEPSTGKIRANLNVG